jgi:hypothetical protein
VCLLDCSALAVLFWRGDKGGLVVLGLVRVLLLLRELHHSYLHGVSKRTVAFRPCALVCTKSTVLDLKVV